ncbi:MAG: hypothetical protein OCU20_07185 [Methanophagales archaeon]|nr:hypothetical protein [Methanophagales archaeon]MCW3137958.1 hypothetical protein [Methanophagales archaeon]MCW7073650.1 hypothetical protein [Methanophagales archaeon]
MKLELTFDGSMKRLIFLSLLLILLLLLPHVHALQMLSDDQVSIDSPIDDDVFATGGTVTINAPVTSAVIAGGTVTINAPVSGDVFVAGGQILVNSDIKGKIVAAGGDIDLRGAAENAVIAGGDIDIHSTTVINRDAVITGGNVSNAGKILGNLTVRADNFLNTGSAGSIDFKKNEGLRGLRNLINTFSILMTAGFLIVGIILLKLFPRQFFIVESEIRKSPVKNTLVGFVLIIASVIVITLLSLTIVGFPIALIMGMLFIIALMLSSIFVSFAVGRKIVDLFKVKFKLNFKLKFNDLLIFVLGFVILSLLFRIPYAGVLIVIIAVSLGFGAIIYALRENWQNITT